MSGMEPLVALGVACNILQIITIARETIRIAKEIKDGTQLDPALVTKAADLEDLSARIQSSTKTVATVVKATPRDTTIAGGAPVAYYANPQRSLSAEDQQLLDLADKCVGAARDLRDKVNELIGPPTTSRAAGRFKFAFRVWWNRQKLEGLERKLHEAEQLLQMGLLTRIYERAESTGGGVAALDADLRSFLDEYRRDYVRGISAAAAEARRTREHVTTEFKLGESPRRCVFVLLSDVIHCQKPESSSQSFLKRTLAISIGNTRRSRRHSKSYAYRGRCRTNLCRATDDQISLHQSQRRFRTTAGFNLSGPFEGSKHSQQSRQWKPPIVTEALLDSSPPPGYTWEELGGRPQAQHAAPPLNFAGSGSRDLRFFVDSDASWTRSIKDQAGHRFIRHNVEGGKTMQRGQQTSNGGGTLKQLLVCAPGNAAVDELVLRLKEGIKTTGGSFHKINVVRLGRSDAIIATGTPILPLVVPD
ncbi:hypothetical protein V8F06_008292 [Rhypophila decipiens]